MISKVVLDLMILRMMLVFDDFEDDAGILTILILMLDLDDFEDDAGF